MDHDLITAAGALLLAFLMGAVAGVAFTIGVLVRHTQRQAKKAANPKLSDMVEPIQPEERRRRIMSDALDRRVP